MLNSGFNASLTFVPPESVIARIPALGECVVTARTHCLSNVQGDVAVRQANQAGFAHQRLARLLNPASSICSVPLLTEDGRCAGALLVAWSNRSDSQDLTCGHIDFRQAASTPLAEMLLNIERNTPSKLAASWVVAPFDAPLNKAYVTPGQSVKTGELLFTFDCEETLNKLASLRWRGSSCRLFPAMHNGTCRHP